MLLISFMFSCYWQKRRDKCLKKEKETRMEITVLVLMTVCQFQCCKHRQNKIKIYSNFQQL